AGSKVCCGGTSIGTTLSPTVVLKDNTYYWRMRALDGDGNAGIWNLGPAYTKTFDKVPPVTAPSVKNLRMRDHLTDPGTDVAPGTAGYQTRVPILAWDAVPGAASYQVDVAPFSVSCDWSSPARWSVLTSTTWWTPLASVWNNVKPYPDTATMLAYDPAKVLATQPYCARVRARSDRDGSNGDVYGDYTYLEDGETGASFTFAGYDSGSACTPSCNPGYLGAGDYLQPISGTVNRTTPLFTWRPLSGIQSYFVIVAKDASFSNIVDYALTRIPAYAPRSMMKPTTYSDETTLYYWAVLPASGVDGSGAAGNPLLAARENFQKNSTPPSLLAPASGTDVLAQPTLQWTPATGARRYRLQVAQDPSFSTLVDDVVTTSTAYTAQATYPADTLLYWRVRADDENLIGLNWSAVGTFRKRLLAPAPDPSNPAAGELIPTWRWSPVQGAASYDLLAHYPNGREELVSGLRASAITATQLTGQGIWTLRVRANFPKGSANTQTTPGPWSAPMPFTRMLGEPSGANASVSGTHVLFAWEPKAEAHHYRVQVSQTADFAIRIEDVTTENTSYAPTLEHFYYRSGGTFYWRVAAMDEDNNMGDFSPAQKFTLAGKGSSVATAGRLLLSANRLPRRGRLTAVTIRVISSRGKPVPGAAVRVTGARLRPQARRTNRAGKVVFRVKPRMRGKLLFRAVKTRYTPGTLRLQVL
ncbi:MAG: hypothetical protein ICV59_10075, partial [Thermoleophilia bacterium]|nr:hypothetical protein [Thermoleophilia bacterium]